MGRGRCGTGVGDVDVSGVERAGGTGSCPPGWKGWQRSSRRTASHPPRAAPYVSTASSAYAEQVGWKRHAGGVMGEIQRR